MSGKRKKESYNSQFFRFSSQPQPALCRPHLSNMAEQELNSLFVKAQSYCLNASPSHPFTNLNSNIGGDASLLCLRSDTDEQLLIHIVFLTAVRVSALSLSAPIDESSPTSVKLYTNLTSPAFTDINDQEISQTLALTEEDLSMSRKLTLKQVKFQRVASLTLFFDENKGAAPFTSLSGLKLFGHTLDGLDVGTIHQQHNHSH